MKPAEHERHCSLCEGQYIHDECDGLGLGPPDHAEHEQQPSSEAPINPACMQSFDGRDWASDFRATAKSLGYCDMDEGWLIGWFANAIMRGFDESERRRDAEQERAAQACSPRLNPDGSPHGRRNDDGYCSVHDATMDRCTHGVAAARAEGARAMKERCLAVVKRWKDAWCDNGGWLDACELIEQGIRAAQDEPAEHEQAAQDSLTRLAIDVARAEGAREMKERMLRVLKNCVESERESDTHNTGLVALEAAYELVAIRAARV